MIEEKELRAALNKTDLCLRDKNEVLNKLHLSGLVKKEMVIKYGVLFNKVTMKFETCAYNDELIVDNETHTIIAADLELNKAGYLTSKYNEVNRNGETI